MIHALTIDVEDYYSIVLRDRLGQVDARPTDAVVRTTERVLVLLDRHDIRGTFFVLGEVVEAFPELVRRIADAGHEVGVHGYYHRQIFKMSRDEFRREVGDARKRIEDLTGRSVDGHRAPAFSIRSDTAWALGILAELGFRYDSSIYPVSGRRYGWSGFREDIHTVSLPGGATIIEAPLSTVHLCGKSLPACGGGYLRHFPYWYTRWAMNRIQAVRPAIVYMHPHEIDVTSGPFSFEERLASADKATRKFHSHQIRNRRTVEAKLSRLLRDFSFAPLQEVIDETLRT